MEKLKSVAAFGIGLYIMTPKEVAEWKRAKWEL